MALSSKSLRYLKDVSRAIRQIERARDIHGDNWQNTKARDRVERVKRAVKMGEERRANPALKQREERISAGRRRFKEFEQSPRGRDIHNAVQAHLGAGIAGDRYVRSLNAFGYNNAAKADERAWKRAKKEAEKAIKKTRLSRRAFDNAWRYLGK